MLNCVLWLEARRLLVRWWVWEEHMCIGQTPASSLRQRNNISETWGLESQAETPNNSVPANWNSHIFLGLWGEAIGSSQFGIRGWCPILFRKESPFLQLANWCWCISCIMNMPSSAFATTLLSLEKNAYVKGKLRDPWGLRGRMPPCPPLDLCFSITPNVPIPILPSSFNQQTNVLKDTSQIHRKYGPPAQYNHLYLSHL